MLLYHAMYDIVYVFAADGDFSWYSGIAGQAWQQLIACTFILLSGLSANLGSHGLKRGFTVFVCGAIVSVATALFFPSELIIFGVLTFLGAASMIASLLSKPLSRVKPTVGAVLSFLLFCLTRHIDLGFIGFFGVKLISLPKALYSLPGFSFFGFPSPSFHSADYFPLLPWLFLFYLGYFASKPLLKSEGVRRFLSKSLCHPLEFVGRHTLIMYMAHQPVIYVIFLIFLRVIPNM